jgi:hypothetical protein
MIVSGSLVLDRVFLLPGRGKIPTGSIGETRVIVTTFSFPLHHFAIYTGKGNCNCVQLYCYSQSLCSHPPVTHVSKTPAKFLVYTRQKREREREKEDGKRSVANVYMQLMANDLGRSR